MNLIVAIKVIQIIVALLLGLFILFQTKGGGLSAAVGGAFGAYKTKRGVERVVFILTIFFAVILTANSLVLISLG